MADSIIHFIALALYVSVGVLFFRQLALGQAARGSSRLAIVSLGLGAILIHGAILYKDALTHGGLDLSFMSSASLVAWAVATIFVISAIKKPIDNLGIVIMPLAGIIITASWIWPGPHGPILQAAKYQSLHIAISLLAYSLLSIAAAQSILLLIQERHLHKKHPGGFIRALPPMQTMETLMFQMVIVGFTLLTLTLISGFFFSEELFNKPLQFTHHIILSIIAWIVFAVLLLGRWRLGWRGRTAVHWILGGFILLVLAYFGSKFVFEFVLKR